MKNYPVITRNDWKNPPKGYAPTASDLASDYETFFTPRAQIVELADYDCDWGVASGLEVTQNNDADELQVAPGVAIDSSGQVIVLASQQGDLGKLSTPGNPAGLYYVIIKYCETASSNGQDQLETLLFEPQIDLYQPGTEPLLSVVLAVVDIDANGKVKNLAPSIPPSPLSRKPVGVPAGEIRLRRSETTADGKQVLERNLVTIHPSLKGDGVVIEGSLSVVGDLDASGTTTAKTLNVTDTATAKTLNVTDTPRQALCQRDSHGQVIDRLHRSDSLRSDCKRDCIGPGAKRR